MIIAAWPAEAFTAIARGRTSAGTSAGNIDCSAGNSNALAVPITNTSNRMPSSWMPCARLRPASSAIAIHSATWPNSTMRRRSNWSATCPAGNASSSDGTNCTRPIRPRSNARPVIA